MKLSVGSGGAWKDAEPGSSGTGTAIGVGGAWKSIKGMWVGSGGSWKQFFQAAFPQLTDLSDPLTSVEPSITGNLPQVSIRFNTDGTIDEASGDTGSALSYSQVGDWLNIVPPDDASDWEVRVTIDSETGAAGTWSGSTGSFVALSSTRTYTWTKDSTADGTASSEVTITLRQVSDTSNSASRSNLTYEVVISS